MAADTRLVCMESMIRDGGDRFPVLRIKRPYVRHRKEELGRIKRHQGSAFCSRRASATSLLVLLILFLLIRPEAFAQQPAAFPRPFGIYTIGQTSPTGIRDYPFIDGFVMRIDWSLVEPQRDAYDFSAIDAVVRRLDTLEQGLTLDVFRMRTPNYIMQLPGVQTHVLQLSKDSFHTAVPWDTIALHRFERLHIALGDHRVWSIRHNTSLPLRDHPVLRQIDATPIGTNGIRDLNHSLTSHPTYTRPVFVDAVARTAEIIRTHFPNTFCFVALFGIQDAIASPRLTDVIRDRLLRLNSAPGRPMLGFFQENLSCSGPIAGNSNPLYAARDSTFTMYQMLQSWRKPFLDSSKTDICKTDTTGPDVAMLKALAVTHGMYFELYISDLDFPGYAAMFQRMHDSLAHLNGTPTSVTPESGDFTAPDITLHQNFPNPFSSTTTIRMSTAANSVTGMDGVSLQLCDMLGRMVATLPARSPAPGILETVLDGSTLTTGTYILRFSFGGSIRSRVLTIQR